MCTRFRKVARQRASTLHSTSVSFSFSVCVVNFYWILSPEVQRFTSKNEAMQEGGCLLGWKSVLAFAIYCLWYFDFKIWKTLRIGFSWQLKCLQASDCADFYKLPPKFWNSCLSIVVVIKGYCCCEILCEEVVVKLLRQLWLFTTCFAFSNGCTFVRFSVGKFVKYFAVRIY